jgi:hypothetical protein
MPAVPAALLFAAVFGAADIQPFRGHYGQIPEINPSASVNVRTAAP